MTPESSFEQQRKRSTKEEYAQRCEDAADLLAEGYPGRVVVKKLTEKFDVTPQQARSYVREGEKLAKEAVPVHDRAFLFAQTFAGLQADRIAAREAGNINAQVGASKQLVQMLKLISEIDPMRDFENAFLRAVAPNLSKGNEPIPRESITIATPSDNGLF
jgi:hypothetical protein